MPKLDVIIDVSNVARDRRLGGGEAKALLSRYLAVCDAWRRHFPDRTTIRGVADANLRHKLGNDDQNEFEAQVHKGLIEEVKAGEADPKILELAQRHGAMIVSRDNFADYRKTDGTCWIQNNNHQFYDWKGTLKSGVQLRLRDMGYRATEDIRQKRREASAKARKADGQALRDEAAARFRCGNVGGQCMYATGSCLPEGVNPNYDEAGKPTCPHCGTFLERIELAADPWSSHELAPGGAEANSGAGEAVLQDEETAVKHDAPEPTPLAGQSATPAAEEQGANAESLVDTSAWPLSSGCLQIWRRGVVRQLVELPRGAGLVFGRTRHVFDLRPFADGDEMLISRQHVQITLESDGQAYVTDLGSKHGTWVNDDQLDSRADELLHEGDEITLAGDVITIVYWSPRDCRR